MKLLLNADQCNNLDIFLISAPVRSSEKRKTLLKAVKNCTITGNGNWTRTVEGKEIDINLIKNNFGGTIQEGEEKDLKITYKMCQQSEQGCLKCNPQWFGTCIKGSNFIAKIAYNGLPSCKNFSIYE